MAYSTRRASTVNPLECASHGALLALAEIGFISVRVFEYKLELEAKKAIVHGNTKSKQLIKTGE